MPDSPGPVGDFLLLLDEEYRSCHRGLGGTDPTRCQILLNEASSSVCSFGVVGTPWWRMPLLRLQLIAIHGLRSGSASNDTLRKTSYIFIERLVPDRCFSLGHIHCMEYSRCRMTISPVKLSHTVEQNPHSSGRMVYEVSEHSDEPHCNCEPNKHTGPRDWVG